jgi:methylated-DNA-protein-cysteine methyltransferase related protein
MKPEYRRIFQAVAAIPPGRVASYGQIAARAGLPGRARMVGKVLGHSDGGEELPWFRVLRADGRIAFAPGSRGYREQIERLLGEGVDVRNGRIRMSEFGLDHDLDRELWGMPD